MSPLTSAVLGALVHAESDFVFGAILYCMTDKSFIDTRVINIYKTPQC